MIRYLFIFLVYLNYLTANAQDQTQKKSIHSLLIGVRTDPVIWYEFGYMHIGKRFQNFQIKGSFAENKEEPSRRPIITNYQNINGYINFVSSFYTLKPGYVLAKNEGRGKTFYLFVNGLLGFSKNQLNININDPIKGETTTSHSEKHFYKSIELEANWHVIVTKHIHLKLGPLMGVQLNTPILFENIYDGAFSQINQYKPGMGYFRDVYVAINFGLAINLN